MFKSGTIQTPIILWFSFLSGAALAHHSLLTYDTSQIVEFEGEVTDVFWRNPHVRLIVRSVDEAGDERIWTAEGSPVNAMERAGIHQALRRCRGSCEAGGPPFGLFRE